jgi:hypothetical protein
MSLARGCGHWTQALGSVSQFSELWSDVFWASIYAETGVSGAFVTVGSCLDIGMPSFSAK